ncbi:MAG: hypothetical protein PWQ96_1987 [Clostridia bacterium]|nr:putative rane protein [Clostridiales bacterium]MDK2986343.1 hypothetical protein [Clostridia bacterium]
MTNITPSNFLYITQNNTVMTEQKKLSLFTIAATYIGTVVGAGFASGQEVLQFFGYFGFWGIIGLIITTVLLVVFGYIILELGRRLKADSHLPVIKYAGGKWIGTIIDWTITFFLFGGLVAMAAGAGAIFVEQFKLSFFWGSLTMIGVTLFTVLTGISGVITSISFVVPLLLTAVFSVALYTIFTDFGAIVSSLANYSNVTRAAVPFWPLSALLYASYNLVLAVALLAPLGTMADKSKLKLGAILGGIGLGIGATAINLTMLANINQAATYEIPMIFMAGAISPLVRTGYTLVLIAEIYTTAVSSLYGFVARLSKAGTSRYRWLAIGSSVVAFGLAQFGFSNLVGTLFPAVGFAGLLLLGSLVYGLFTPSPTAPVKTAAAFEAAKEIAAKEEKPNNDKKN